MRETAAGTISTAASNVVADDDNDYRSSASYIVESA